MECKSCAHGVWLLRLQNAADTRLAWIPLELSKGTQHSEMCMPEGLTGVERYIQSAVLHALPVPLQRALLSTLNILLCMSATHLPASTLHLTEGPASHSNYRNRRQPSKFCYCTIT